MKSCVNPIKPFYVLDAMMDALMTAMGVINLVSSEFIVVEEKSKDTLILL